MKYTRPMLHFMTGAADGNCGSGTAASTAAPGCTAGNLDGFPMPGFMCMVGPGDPPMPMPGLCYSGSGAFSTCGTGNAAGSDGTGCSTGATPNTSCDAGTSPAAF